MLRVLTFNVLAPNFTDPKYYPLESHAYLPKERRRDTIIRFLRSIKDSYDIISLQEVTDDTVIIDHFGNLDTGTNHVSFGEYRHFDNALPEFTGMFVSHDPSHWSSYFGSTTELSYIRNGNALFFRRSLFICHTWKDIPLTTGNHAVMGLVTHRPTMKRLRVINVHLDNESNNTRFIELREVLSTIPHDKNIIDLVMGDFNTDIHHISELVYGGKFKDTLSQLGDKHLTYALLAGKEGPIDYIIYRGDSVHVSCSLGVLGSDLWKTYPVINQLDPLGPKRLNACLESYGSDHIPVDTVFTI